MRPIKFRAWDKKEKKMIDDFAEWNLILYNGGVEVGFHLEAEGGEVIEGDYELMQYTGLKDKNGKEIWEGDIVRGAWELLEEKIRNELTAKELPNYEVGKVVYDPPQFLVTTGGHSVELSELAIPFYADRLLVLGNVYENPKLMGNLYKKEFAERKRIWKSYGVLSKEKSRKLDPNSKEFQENLLKLQMSRKLSAKSIFGYLDGGENK